MLNFVEDLVCTAARGRRRRSFVFRPWAARLLAAFGEEVHGVPAMIQQDVRIGRRKVWSGGCNAWPRTSGWFGVRRTWPGTRVYADIVVLFPYPDKAVDIVLLSPNPLITVGGGSAPPCTCSAILHENNTPASNHPQESALSPSPNNNIAPEASYYPQKSARAPKQYPLHPLILFQNASRNRTPSRRETGDGVKKLKKVSQSFFSFFTPSPEMTHACTPRPAP